MLFWDAASNGNSYNCSTQGNGANINPENTKDSMSPGIFKFMMPVQLRS